MGPLNTKQHDVRSVRLADAVHYYRTEKKLSSRALSLAAGLSPSYVGKLESGEIEPSVRAFARIALILGMNQQEIYLCVIQEGLREPSVSPSIRPDDDGKP